jgi:pteridine reductase
MELRGRVALVTGAGIRVGRAIALALGEQGANVAVHYNGSRDEAEETRTSLLEMGVRSELFQADLTDPAAPQRLVGDVQASLGPLDILINSAAGMERTPFAEATVEEWDRIMALNLRAPFFLAQAAAAAMGERGGAIVNVADLAAFENWPAYVPHGISKAGLVQMTRSLARVLAPRIRVNAVAPGTVLLPEKTSADESERLRATTPMGVLGSPADVTAAIIYLLGAEFVTGETIIVDGGRHVRC